MCDSSLSAPEPLAMEVPTTPITGVAVAVVANAATGWKVRSVTEPWAMVPPCR
jgi:hypothetical protein